MRVESAAVVIGVVCLSAFTCPKLGAQTYGIDFATVGAAGNRSTTPIEAPEWISRGGVGGVGHGFKIARTELSVAQYLEFVQAFSPYFSGNPYAFELTGFWIGTPDGQNYQAYPGSENFPADMTWQMAARYCNWLTNGKAATRQAFETGAYDTSTFTRNANGSWNDQAIHSPGATFWIPTLDEWTKAVYFDPNRYGPGVEGYWSQPNGTNTPLISGFPSDGGETSAGINDSDPLHTVPIGSYPHVQSPWGLLDASGGLAEWTELLSSDRTSRLYKGTWQGAFGYEYGDTIVAWGASPPNIGSLVGLRIATIPGPSVVSVLGLGIAVSTNRRRRS